MHILATLHSQCLIAAYFSLLSLLWTLGPVSYTSRRGRRPGSATNSVSHLNHPHIAPAPIPLEMAPGYPGPSTVGVVMGPPGENGVIMASPGMHPHIGPQMELPPGGMMHMNMQGAIVSQAPPQVQGYPSAESSQGMMISPGPPPPMATMVQQAPHTHVHSEEAAYHQQQAAAAHAAAQQANLQQHVAMATPGEHPVTIVTAGETQVLDVIHQAQGTPSSSREHEEQQAAGLVPPQSSEHYSGVTTPCHEAITPEPPALQPPSSHTEGMTPSDMHPHSSAITPTSIESQQHPGVMPSPTGMQDSCLPPEEACTPASVSPALPGPPPLNAQQHAASPQCGMEPTAVVHCPVEQPNDPTHQTLIHPSTIPGPIPVVAPPHPEMSTGMESRENNDHLDMEATTE